MSAIAREFDTTKVDIEWLEEYQRELMLEKASLRKLTEFPGWALYVEFLETNAKTLSGATHGTVFQNFGDVFSDQYAKGEAAGLMKAPTILESIVALYDTALHEVQALIQEKNNAGPSSDTSDSDDTSRPEPELFDADGPNESAP